MVIMIGITLCKCVVERKKDMVKVHMRLPELPTMGGDYL